MALTKVYNRMIADLSASILDFGADPTGTSDSTAAIHIFMQPEVIKFKLPQVDS